MKPFSAIGVGAALALILAMCPPPAGANTLPTPPATTSVAAEQFSVTLITGDKVTVTPDGTGRHAFTIDKGPGRADIPFFTSKSKTGLTVIPADAASLIAENRLDSRLFDVMLLRSLHYDDAHVADLPLLVEGAPAAMTASRTVRTIASLDLTSVRTAKQDTARFWADFTAGAIRKLWLVGKLKPSLDVSVPQIGAPEAWAAGQTGKGATVAILDTGIDTGHADFQNAITETKNFIDPSADVTDNVGHGTHVAGIIAGHGTASGGKYTGVAKGASLKIGKVCEWDGCPEDAILDGMAWAADSGAKVVNMSLGGPASETADLLADAVDRYSVTRGVLFVIAAGNYGAAETIGSPGTADEALTVGSVDKRTDALSEFSSRGPRVVPSRRLDYAVKPDITAPGADIVSARAKGTLDDEKVDESYARLSGTSMATPHVAGSAAILAAAHPDWTGSRIKSALMSTAKVVTGQTVYDQGAGRVDVARAVRQDVTATGSVSLGYFPWPNADAPTSGKTVTYTNHGTTAVTLDLGLAVADSTGKPAAAGMFDTSAKTVTIPAGGTATTRVTIAPQAGVTGLYSGVLTARSSDGQVEAHTAVGAYKEPESYNLSFLQLGPTAHNITQLMILNEQTGVMTYRQLFERSFLRRMPAGSYTVMATTFDQPETPTDRYNSTVETRRIQLGAPTELAFDTRKGKPVQVDVEGVPEAVVQDSVAFDVAYGDHTDYGLGFISPPEHAMVVPGTNPSPGLSYSVLAPMSKKGTGRPGLPATPWTYNGALARSGTLPATPHFTIKPGTLATVTQRVGRQGPTEARDLFHAGFTPASLGYSYVAATPLGDLTERKDYFTTDPDTTFIGVLRSGSDLGGGENSRDYETRGLSRGYQQGEKTVGTWNNAVFGPAFVPGGYRSATRDGDVLTVATQLLADRDRDHYTFERATDLVDYVLSRDGKVIESGKSAQVRAILPPDSGTYQLRVRTERTVPWTGLSKKVDVTWTFTSQHTTAVEDVPLQSVRYSPALDGANQAPSGTFLVPLRVDRLGSGTAPLAKLTVEVSSDSGATWTSAEVVGLGSRRIAIVRNPAGGSVSLRAVAEAPAGNTVEQTIIGAYTVR